MDIIRDLCIREWRRRSKCISYISCISVIDYILIKLPRLAPTVTLSIDKTLVALQLFIAPLQTCNARALFSTNFLAFFFASVFLLICRSFWLTPVPEVPLLLFPSLLFLLNSVNIYWLKWWKIYITTTKVTLFPNPREQTPLDNVFVNNFELRYSHWSWNTFRFIPNFFCTTYCCCDPSWRNVLSWAIFSSAVHEITSGHRSMSSTNSCVTDRIHFLAVTMTGRFSNFNSISYTIDRHEKP